MELVNKKSLIYQSVCCGNDDTFSEAAFIIKLWFFHSFSSA